MPRCPVCDSMRVIIIVNRDRHAFCPECGSRWKQEGSQQRNVTPSEYTGLRMAPSADVSSRPDRHSV